jgi:hypothetical protein
LILPALKNNTGIQNDKHFNDLFDLTDPGVVVIPYADSDFTRFLKDRDISLIDLSASGSATFSVGKEPGADQSFHIQSFLSGAAALKSGEIL